MKLEQVLKNAVGKNHPLGVKLRVLSLKGNKIGNIGFEAICNSLKKNGYLEYLDVSDNQIEDRGMFVCGQML